MPFHKFRPADDIRPERIPIRVRPIGAATENKKMMAALTNASHGSVKTALFKIKHVRMPPRASKRDAMEIIYRNRPPQCGAPEVSHLHTFSEHSAPGSAGGRVEVPDLNFDIFDDATTERRFRSIEARKNEAPEKNVRWNIF